MATLYFSVIFFTYIYVNMFTYGIWEKILYVNISDEIPNPIQEFLKNNFKNT